MRELLLPVTLHNLKKLPHFFHCIDSRFGLFGRNGVNDVSIVPSTARA
jgi:hypothetical protein